MLQVLSWWVIVQILGWVALPVAWRLLRWLPGRGYAFSKTIGLLLVSYLLWLGASLGVLRNDLSGILGALLLVAAVSSWLLWRGREADGRPTGEALRAFLRERTKLIFTVEFLFTVAFVAWAILRAYASFKINPAGGEKFMEITFMNGILNSPRFPPLDPWMSGFAISYYYFGYVMMALMTRLSGVLPGVGFDLYDALLFALTLTGAFGVVYNLVAGSRKTGPGGSGALAYGLLGAVFVGVMGNLEGVIEILHTRGLLSQRLVEWIGVPGLAEAPVTGTWNPGMAGGWFWWWRSSRVLQDVDLLQQPLGISPITEYPFFSFLLGDNHPHVLALPFVLLAVGLGLNLLRMQLARPVQAPAGELPEAGQLSQEWSFSDFNPVRFAFGGCYWSFGFYSLALGALGFLNTWDMPIYIGLIVLSYGAAAYARQARLDGRLALEIVILGVSLLVSSVALYIFFFLGFRSQAGGVLPYLLPPTRLPQYLVMFGTFILILSVYLIQYLRVNAPQPARAGLRAYGWALAAGAGAFILVSVLVALAFGLANVQGSGAELASALAPVTGNLVPLEAFAASLQSRLVNPWLFLALTLLLGLAAAGFAAAARRRRTTAEVERGGTLLPQASNWFALILVFTGLLLSFSVEYFYLRDSFGLRMNTVFKFYYQTWVMAGCAGAYATWWLLHSEGRLRSGAARGLFSLAAGLLVLGGLSLTALGVFDRVGGFQTAPDLNGSSEIAQNNPDDWAAIEWLRANAIDRRAVEPQAPVILEAPGDNYKYEGRISAFTGLPAVLGWYNHENQWRGSFTEQARRIPDIETIYTTGDARLMLDLLHQYDVRYVIVGNPERSYITQLCSGGTRVCNLTQALRKFEVALDPVFQQGQVTIYQVPPDVTATP